MNLPFSLKYNADKNRTLLPNRPWFMIHKLLSLARLIENFHIKRGLAILSGNFRVRFSRTFKYRCLSVFKSGMILQCPVQTSNSEVLDFASLFSDLQASTFVFDLGLLWSQVTGCLPGCGLAYNNRNVLELLELENLTSSNLGSIIIYWYGPFDMPAVFIHFIKSLRKPY